MPAKSAPKKKISAAKTSKAPNAEEVVETPVSPTAENIPETLATPPPVEAPATETPAPVIESPAAPVAPVPVAPQDQVSGGSVASTSVPTQEPEVPVEESVPIPDAISPDAPLKVESEEESQGEELPPIEKKNKKIYIAGIVIALLLIVATGVLGFYFLNSGKEDKKVEVAEDKTVEATPTLIEEIDRAEWSIEVLNGSTTTGVARTVADSLEELGYTVENVGNADNKDYEETTVLISSEKSDEEAELFVDEVKKATGVDVLQEKLEDSTLSARIIIGSDFE